MRDLFALSSDSDPSDKATQMFFAETQNKLLYVVSRKTAAELIVSSADPNTPHMGLTNWKGVKVRKQYILIAKNYLNEDEIDSLNRLVTLFLESAELRVKDKRDQMAYWKRNVDQILDFQDRPILSGPGRISKKSMETQVKRIYDRYNAQRLSEEVTQADGHDLVDLWEIEKELKDRKRDNDGAV